MVKKRNNFLDMSLEDIIRLKGIGKGQNRVINKKFKNKAGMKALISNKNKGKAKLGIRQRQLLGSRWLKKRKFQNSRKLVQAARKQVIASLGKSFKKQNAARTTLLTRKRDLLVRLPKQKIGTALVNSLRSDLMNYNALPPKAITVCIPNSDTDQNWITSMDLSHVPTVTFENDEILNSSNSNQSLYKIHNPKLDPIVQAQINQLQMSSRRNAQNNLSYNYIQNKNATAVSIYRPTPVATSVTMHERFS